MTVYRLSRARYAGDLSGEGARLWGGRWNQRGTAALYIASSVSLAVLETLVHVVDRALLPPTYEVTVIEVPEEGYTEVTDLPDDYEEGQQLGDGLLRAGATLGFWIPSATIPSELNLTLSPYHPRYRELVRVRETYTLPLDRRFAD